MSGAQVSDEVRRLHKEHLVIDSLAGGPGVFPEDIGSTLDRISHLPTPELFWEIERLRTRVFVSGTFDEYWVAIDEAMVDVLSVSIGAWGDRPFSYRGAVQDLGEWHRRFRNVSRFCRINTPADLSRAKREGRLGVLLGFQDSAQLEGDLRNLETFHALGVRMIQLTYNGHGLAGSGCTAPVDRGLTLYGRDLIRVMNDLAMIIDLSHCGPRTSLQAIEASRAPVAVSHSACHSIHPHARNKTDDVLRALRDSGGYFGVCVVPAFIADPRYRPSVDCVVRHLFHALEVCGPGLVGVGSDWGVDTSPAALTDRLRQEARNRGFREKDGFDFAAVTEGFESWASGWPRITQALADAGLAHDTISDVLGGSFARVYHEIEKAAQRALPLSDPGAADVRPGGDPRPPGRSR